jgi:hypothetical protein
MPNWLDSTGEILTLVAILSAALAALLWIIKSQVAMSREFKPNSGSTARDALDRIERKLDNVERKIDNHINWHLGD